MIGAVVLVVVGVVVGMQLGGDDSDDETSDGPSGDETADISIPGGDISVPGPESPSDGGGSEQDDGEEGASEEAASEEGDDTGDGGSSGSGAFADGPDTAAAELVQMVLDGNCTDTWEYSTASFQEEYGSAEELCGAVDSAMPEGDYSIEEARTHPGAIADAAGVDVDVVGDLEFAITFQMLLEDGTWKMDDIYYPGSD